MAVGNHTLPTELLRNCNEGIFWCLSDWASVVSQGAFWVLMLLAFCTVLFLATARQGATRAFSFASFVGLLGAIWLAVMKLMAWHLATVFIIVGIIAIVIRVMSEGVGSF